MSYQANVDELIRLVAELRGHIDKKLSCHVNWILERNVLITADIVIRELPDGISQPLLVDVQVCDVGVLALIRLNKLYELLLKTSEILGGERATGLVPSAQESTVEWSEEVDHRDEPIDLVAHCIARIITDCWKVDSSLEGHGAATLHSI